MREVIIDYLAEKSGGALQIVPAADDYVVKPFSLAVLYAKVQALLRRAKGLTREGRLAAGALALDPVSDIAFANGARLDLPPKEFALLMEHKGQLLSREALVVRVWGWDFDGTDRVVDSHIKKLRKALGPYAGYIKTVVKAGYRLGVEEHERQT